MRIIVFNSLKDAVERNHEEAVKRGCDGVTQYWWPLRIHPTRTEYALCVGEDEVNSNEIVYIMGNDWNN